MNVTRENQEISSLTVLNAKVIHRRSGWSKEWKELN
jgi:hypothetical protein